MSNIIYIGGINDNIVTVTDKASFTATLEDTYVFTETLDNTASFVIVLSL